MVALIAAAALLLSIVLLLRASGHRRRLEELEARITQLERELRRPAAPAPPPPVVAEPSRIEMPTPAPAFATVETAAGPSWRERLREKFAGEEWEAVVGGSWLNKAGGLVLVIGIALFLAYSAVRLGPAGRVLLALAVSFAMLAGGLLLERRGQYLIFARGLLGAGWAALYCTVYGMHALEAARVIRNPLAGAILLVGVALGMIAHSLRYRSQTLTGLAYFAAFVALAVTPVTAFAVVALVPLAASLLYIAHRFSWYSIALFGLVATYGTCATKASNQATVLGTQSILAAYWLLFEGFDVLRSLKQRAAHGPVAWIFPLNAAAGLLLSYLKWSASAPNKLHVLFAAAAVAYLAGAIVRYKIADYRPAITISAAAGALAILLGLSGVWANAALLAEGELLFLFGLRLGQPYMRHLALAVFGVSLLRLPVLRDWPPVALASAALFYLNCALRRPGPEYSYTASALIAIVVGAKAPREFVGLAWLALAVALFEVGLLTRLREFRFQSYGVGALSWATLALLNVFGSGPWNALAAAAFLAYGVAAQTIRRDRLPEGERTLVRDCCSSAGSFLSASVLWYVLPGPLIAPAWSVFGLALLVAGIRWNNLSLRGQSYLLAICTFVRTWSANFYIAESRILTGAIVVAAFYASEFLAPRTRDRTARLFFSLLASILLAVMLYYEVSGSLLTVAWGMQGIALLLTGFPARERSLRLSGLALFLFCILKLFLYDLSYLETLYRILSFIVLGLLLLGASWIYTKFRAQLRQYL